MLLSCAKFCVVVALVALNFRCLTVLTKLKYAVLYLKDIFKTQLYIESQRMSPHFYLVIGIVGGVLRRKRREAKRSEPCAASTTTPQFDNPAYEAGARKTPALGEDDYSSVDGPLSATHAGDPEIPKQTHAKLTSKNPDGNVYQSIDRRKEEDLIGQMYDYIEMEDKHAISGATKGDSDEPIYDCVVIPAEGHFGFTNQAYDC